MTSDKSLERTSLRTSSNPTGHVEPLRGEGAGVITNDGCAVEVYLKLPYRNELEFAG